jgi:hypothetical protein
VNDREAGRFDQAARLGMSSIMDPLSEVILSLRLTGGLFLDARFTAPWCVTSQITAEDCQPFMAKPAEIVAYRVVIEACFC